MTDLVSALVVSASVAFQLFSDKCPEQVCVLCGAVHNNHCWFVWRGGAGWAALFRQLRPA